MVKGLETHIKKLIASEERYQKSLSHRRAEDRRQLGEMRGRNAGQGGSDRRLIWLGHCQTQPQAETNF